MTVSFRYLHLNKKKNNLNDSLRLKCRAIFPWVLQALPWHFSVHLAGFWWRSVRESHPVEGLAGEYINKGKRASCMLLCDIVWIYAAARTAVCTMTCTENEIFIEVHGHPASLQSEHIQAFNVHVIFRKVWTFVTESLVHVWHDWQTTPVLASFLQECGVLIKV